MTFFADFIKNIIEYNIFSSVSTHNKLEVTVSRWPIVTECSRFKSKDALICLQHHFMRTAVCILSLFNYTRWHFHNVAFAITKLKPIE